MTNSKKPFVIALIFDFLAISGLFLAKSIASLMLKILPNCFFITKFSVLCPSCGCTRAVFNLFSGNFSAAYKFNQFFFLLLFYLIIIFIFMNLGFVFNIIKAKLIFLKLTNYKVIIALAVLWVLFGILRNFDFLPF